MPTRSRFRPGRFFQRVCRLPLKNVGHKRKVSSSQHHFQRVLITLLGCSMAAEKANIEDDGIWICSLGPYDVVFVGVCGDLVEKTFVRMLKRPCWTHPCFVFIPILGEIWFKLNSIKIDWIDWLERLLRIQPFALGCNRVTCEKGTRKPWNQQVSWNDHHVWISPRQRKKTPPKMCQLGTSQVSLIPLAPLRWSWDCTCNPLKV